MSEFQNIGLIGCSESDSAVLSLKCLVAFLEREGFAVGLEQEIVSAAPNHNIYVAPKEKLGELGDVVIVVGGDGSLLAPARALAKFCMPLLGINGDRLGFFTDVTPDEIEQDVGEFMVDGYMTESRFLLDMFATGDGKSFEKARVLDDVIFQSNECIPLIKFGLHTDSRFNPAQHLRRIDSHQSTWLAKRRSGRHLAFSLSE